MHFVSEHAELQEAARTKLCNAEWLSPIMSRAEEDKKVLTGGTPPSPYCLASRRYIAFIWVTSLSLRKPCKLHLIWRTEWRGQPRLNEAILPCMQIACRCDPMKGRNTHPELEWIAKRSREGLSYGIRNGSVFLSHNSHMISPLAYKPASLVIMD